MIYVLHLNSFFTYECILKVIYIYIYILLVIRKSLQNENYVYKRNYVKECTQKMRITNIVISLHAFKNGEMNSNRICRTPVVVTTYLV